ncbi:sugar transporter [Falsigemmobacter faecalis]|uniref:Sugar transporter n=1 Tax=Falsigemmobacter faecalis TaxID=2488730 RepID=A0A3P3DA05_9RHOB|nr:sugar transporter [Falsigemmobacter faecalis]
MTAPVPPPAGPARIRPRHRWLGLSFIALVLLPLALIAAYLFGLARDQYASDVGFTLRQEETPSAGALAGGLASMLGMGAGQANTRVLYEYIRSPALVARVESRLGLRAIYSPGWPQDILYSLPPDATIEELTRFWLRMVRIAFDEASGLMSIQVRAPTPEQATAIAAMVIEEAQSMINGLNTTARADAMHYSTEDLTEAVARLRAARSAMSSFRASTRILDPAADLSGRMGILTSLQEQLATALVENDLLSETTDRADPRRRQLDRRIAVIRSHIEDERRTLGGAAPAGSADPGAPDYPELLARYEELTVDVQVAEMTYRTAQAAHDLARARAERQSLYLATYITPTRAEMSEYPRRFLLSGLGFLFLTLSWVVLVLIGYSLRDRG